jgi:3-hydroxyisobutyrate dehydrogenase-like beta-hydroxyacid dehydrogenase
MKVAFLGLGSMGAPMAANLARGGHDLVVWNRSARQPEGFDAPPRRAGSIGESVRGAEVAVTMLADDAAVDAVVAGGLLDALAGGAVHLSMSTISIAAARRLAEAHLARGRDYVAAPVFGRPDIAAAGKLWIALAGPAAGCARVRPLLDAMGRGVTELGETAWHANLVKLGNNLLLAAMIEALGETIAMMRKAGVEPARFLDAVGAVFASPVYANYGRQIAERRHEPAVPGAAGVEGCAARTRGGGRVGRAAAYGRAGARQPAGGGGGGDGRAGLDGAGRAGAAPGGAGIGQTPGSPSASCT